MFKREESEFHLRKNLEAFRKKNQKFSFFAFLTRKKIKAKTEKRVQEEMIVLKKEIAELKNIIDEVGEEREACEKKLRSILLNADDFDVDKLGEIIGKAKKYEAIYERWFVYDVLKGVKKEMRNVADDFQKMKIFKKALEEMAFCDFTKSVFKPFVDDEKNLEKTKVLEEIFKNLLKKIVNKEKIDYLFRGDD